MAVSEAARRNRDELFPDQASSLQQTDPEFTEYFDNFAFDEVLRESNLDPKTRLLLQLGSMIACQALAEYRGMVEAALTIGVPPVELKEVVYQAVPYVGEARALDFLNTTNAILTGRGIDLPLPGQSTTTPETREERGLAVQMEVVGAARVDSLYASAPPDQTHIQRFLSANCFGDHYTRTGLSLQTRELLTFAILVSLGGCEPQVAGHVAANLNVGNDRGVLIDTLTQLLPYIGYPRTLNGLRMVSEGTPA